MCALTQKTQQEQSYIWPIVAITVSQRTRKFRLNCLFDTGSQRTYFCRKVMRGLGCHRSFLTPVEFNVKTFLGFKKKTLNQVILGIGVDKSSSLALPVLIDGEFDMNFRFDDFKSVKNNLINLNYKLAFLHKQNDVHVHGLLGVDVIQFMKNIKMVDYMKGSAWEFPTGISPFGNCQHLLYKNQITPTKVQGKPSQHNHHATDLSFWIL